jgi:hypothetical protein
MNVDLILDRRNEGESLPPKLEEPICADDDGQLVEALTRLFLGSCYRVLMKFAEVIPAPNSLRMSASLLVTVYVMLAQAKVVKDVDGQKLVELRVGFQGLRAIHGESKAIMDSSSVPQLGEEFSCVFSVGLCGGLVLQLAGTLLSLGASDSLKFYAFLTWVLHPFIRNIHSITAGM